MKNLKIIIAVLVIAIVGAGIFTAYKKFAGKESQPDGANPPQTSKSSIIGDLKFGAVPSGVQFKPGTQLEYKTQFLSGQQNSFDFENIKADTSAVLKIFNEKGEELSMGLPVFELKAGNHGFCCFSMPKERGKYTVKVFKGNSSEILIEKEIEVK